VHLARRGLTGPTMPPIEIEAVDLYAADKLEKIRS
jgi:hypothetical protein